jgi:hypothetical protein
MGRFRDQRLLEIYLYGRTAGVPAEDCATIRGELVTLLAVSGWTGIEIVSDVFPVNGRLAIMVAPDWAISFEWWEGDGALELGLEP